jgi:hypothetical protein
VAGKDEKRIRDPGVWLQRTRCCLPAHLHKLPRHGEPWKAITERSQGRTSGHQRHHFTLLHLHDSFATL